MAILRNSVIILAVLALIFMNVNCQETEEVREKTPQVANETPNNTTDPKFILLFFREDCFYEFLKFNIFYKDCISITLSKGLGYGIILGATSVKFPQLFRIAASRSGQGILPSMFYIESFMYIIAGNYNIHIQSPFSVYGENFFLLLQNFVIIGLLWTFQKDNKRSTQILVAVGMVSLFTYLWTGTYVPEGVWQLLMNLQFLMISYSRLPQIINNFTTKSTGQLSIVTFFLNF